MAFLYPNFSFMIKRFFLIILFIGLNSHLFASDTLLVMNYNLLYYGYYTSYCTSQNNNVEQKAENLHTIINHIRPDVFAVTELGRDASTADHLLNNALNKNDIDFYERAAYTNTANSNIVNMLYYNKSKLGLVSQAVPGNILRDINLYKLYYKADDLAETKDTTFITCVVAHLKAGSSDSDQQVRANMVTNVMTYLDYYNYDGNILFMGDFNINSSYETSYQVLLNYSEDPELRFNDPIDLPGQWWNNSTMALYHSQSTHLSGDCHAGGGLDDRYDFILASNDVLSGDYGFKYVEDSYKTIGQDGLRFDKSLINPTNVSEPEEVINALYDFSDHLPITLELEVTEKIVNNSDDHLNLKKNIRFNNPVTYSLEIIHNFSPEIIRKVEIANVLGNVLTSIKMSGSSLSVNVSDYSPGMYFLIVETNANERFVYKFIKL